MASNFESDIYEKNESELEPPSSWLRVGLIAVASAVLGGMGAAWWYRKTLIRMRQMEETGQNPQFGMPEEPPSDEM